VRPHRAPNLESRERANCCCLSSSTLSIFTAIMSAESLRHSLRLLASRSRRPGLQAALVYLVVAPSASVVSSLVGSLSEYRCGSASSCFYS
jgi:hypothetical protein